MTEKDKLFLKKFCFYFTAFLTLALNGLLLFVLWLINDTILLVFVELAIGFSGILWMVFLGCWVDAVGSSLMLPLAIRLFDYLKRCFSNPWFWIGDILVTFLLMVIGLAWLYLVEWSSWLFYRDGFLALTLPFFYSLGLWKLANALFDND